MPCGWVGLTSSKLEMATTSVVGKKRKAQPLDTSHSSRGIWLVKVPNYLSEAWNRADKGKPVGTMRIRT